MQTFAVDSLNQLTTVARNTNMTVAGTTTSHATSVTVNGGAAILYNDATFARTNVGLVNGNNTFTAIAQDAYGRQDTNTVTAYLPATTAFVYDANGNLRTNGQEILVYDEENRLVTNYVAGSWKSEFVYDGLNRRRLQRDYAWSSGVWSKTNETRLIYDGKVIIQHRDANNLPTLALTRGLDLSGSLQGAGGIGGLLAMTENPGASSVHSFYHSDGNGNVTALISPKQMVVAKAIYDPYGGFISLSGPKAAVNPYWFSAKPFHVASGKYDFLYRWYSSNLQRWVNRDWIGELGGINLYSYVINNPDNYTDPFGLSAEDIKRIFAAAQSATDSMTANGQRADNGSYNNFRSFVQRFENWLGASDRKPYLGCGQQATALARALNGLPTDDKWDFYFGEGITMSGFYHQWVVAQSSNPDDPQLNLDAWGNKFGVEETGIKGADGGKSVYSTSPGVPPAPPEIRIPRFSMVLIP